MTKPSSSFRFLTLSLMLLIFIDLIEPTLGAEDPMVLEVDGQKVNITQSDSVMQLSSTTVSSHNPGIFFIEVSDIKISDALKESSPFRLLVIVTSDNVDTSLSWKQSINKYKNRFSADLDGFATLNSTQTIKHVHKLPFPLTITTYLIDYESDNSDSLKKISASFSISISQPENDTCLPQCQSGTCDEQSFKCMCPLPSLESMYFDRTCADQATQLVPAREILFVTKDIKTFFYIDLQDISRGCSLRVRTSNAPNQISFMIYQEGKGIFSTPNLLVDSFQLDSRATKEFFFSHSWLQQAAAVSITPTNSSLKIVLALYNLAGVESSFRLTFYDSGLGILIEQIPEWAIYFVTILLIAGLMLVASAAFTIIRNRFGENTLHISASPSAEPPLTKFIIEKYMPAKPYSEIKKDVNTLFTECTICLEGYEDTEKVRLSMCGHLFHMDCIDEWITKHASCPYCRHGLTEKDMKKGMLAEMKERVSLKDQKNQELQVFGEQQQSLKGITHKGESELIGGGTKDDIDQQGQQEMNKTEEQTKDNKLKASSQRLIHVCDMELQMSQQSSKESQNRQVILTGKKQRFSRKDRNIRSNSLKVNNLGTDDDASVELKNADNVNIIIPYLTIKENKMVEIQNEQGRQTHGNNKIEVANQDQVINLDNPNQPNNLLSNKNQRITKNGFVQFQEEEGGQQEQNIQEK